VRVSRTFKLTVEYDGSGFWGWQIQPDVRTVQGELKKAVSKLIHGRFRIIGASRTDRGVHATGQVASLHVEEAVFSPDELKRALNALLPDDIYIHNLEEMPVNFNARFHAKSKVYLYRILPDKRSPIRRKYVWDGINNFSPEIARRVFNSLTGEFDFSGLIIGDPRKDTRSRISRTVVREVGDEFHFEIEGDRFFYKLVRILVGFTVSIASGREREEVFRDALNGRRPDIFWIAPPQGLTLLKVNY